MRHAPFSRTNVNPARMFRTGLTPTFTSFLLRDRQSRIDPAWSKLFWLQNLLQSLPFFREKTVKNYHKINEFHDVVHTRPMTSLRWRTWLFSPFLSQDSTTWSQQTSDSSLIDKKWSRIWPLNDQLSDHEYDHKNRNSSSTETLKVEIENSESDFFDISNFRAYLTCSACRQFRDKNLRK